MDMLTLVASILPTPPSGTPAELAQDGLSFFGLWISRIGGLIAFVGAIKFALSVKSDDSKEQLLSILVMVSGFMIRSAIADLSIFNMPATYSASAANTEFQSIMQFIGTWTRRVGTAGLLLGAIMFGFSIKEQNATTKVTALRTLTTGAMVAAISVMLPLFV